MTALDQAGEQQGHTLLLPMALGRSVSHVWEKLGGA